MTKMSIMIQVRRTGKVSMRLLTPIFCLYNTLRLLDSVTLGTYVCNAGGFIWSALFHLSLHRAYLDLRLLKNRPMLPKPIFKIVNPSA